MYQVKFIFPNGPTGHQLIMLFYLPNACLKGYTRDNHNAYTVKSYKIPSNTNNAINCETFHKRKTMNYRTHNSVHRPTLCKFKNSVILLKMFAKYHAWLTFFDIQQRKQLQE